MTDVGEMVPTLQRFVAPAGQFATLFPTTTDEDLVGQLADGFAEAQLAGFFASYELDLDVNEVTPDLSVAQRALVVLFSGIRMIQAELRNRNARSKRHTKYVAGPVSAEVETESDTSGSTVLTELLREYQAEKKAIVTLASTTGAGDFFEMEDAYLSRAVAWISLGHQDFDFQPAIGWL